MKDVTLIGKRIRVKSRHWIRPNATGTVISREKGLHRWIVKFDEEFPGGGFDNGNCLCLEENYFVVIND